MWRFDYSAHEAFVAPAREKAQLWRLVIGFILVLGVFVGLSTAIYSIVFETLYALDGDREFAAVLAILFSFATVILGVFGVTYYVHDRNGGTVLGPRQLVIDHFWMVSLGIVALLIIIAVLPPWGFGEPLIPNRGFGQWLVVLPIALLAVLLQTSAEEILFRGYLQQQLRARFRSPLIWMLMPSALFALAHYDPSNAGENVWIMVAWAGFFGLAMADLTARAGNLGPAMAVHFVNNVSAILFVALPDELGGAALYILPFGMSDVEMIRAWLPVDFVTTFVMWLIARLVIRR